ncbi:MAG: hypothetical protein Ct9H300mP18_11580 [Candidatus Neomarinimicrobiota bacterium]|nr:MAG: hypothetical protein Ct9H300mP18_11580 [Candidatus Neomarinimicrobiota bacterium]
MVDIYRTKNRFKAGNPKSNSAAGSANARNPIPVIIPCHRVLASGGKLGDMEVVLK